MGSSKDETLPVLPWMRKPVKIDDIDKCPLYLLPGLDPRYFDLAQFILFFSIIIVIFIMNRAVWNLVSCVVVSCRRELYQGTWRIIFLFIC